MSQIYCTKKRKPGQHLRYRDRQLLEWIYNRNRKKAKKDRMSQRQLAKKLGISPSTMSRELKRGMVKQLDSELFYYRTYSADVAQQDYDYKAGNKGPKMKIGRDYELAKHIENRLLGIDEEGNRTRGYSPDAVIMELENKGWPFKTKICTKTLYSYIEKDVFFGVTLKHLPRKGKQGKTNRKRRIRRSHTVPDGRQIEERPLEAAERLEPGHWEMDCIESVKSDKACILSLVDRCSRQVYLFKLSRQTQKAVDRALNGLERQLGAKVFAERFKSITVDNGAEFWDWQTLESSVQRKQARTKIYYAHPYSSWERGSNENLNGFVRYSIPKGSRISDYTKKDIKKLENWINNYPRRILEGQSALEFSQAAPAA